MGEFDFLTRLRDRLPPPGPGVVLGSGDDAAITAPAGATATSIDSLVDGVHFRRGTFPLTSIGHKSLAAALSDLAAMGARAGEAYVALGVPPDLGEDECLELLDGLLALARETGTTLAGGDVTRSPVLCLTVTVVGHAPAGDTFVTRAGAHPGDVLIVTGELGGAAAGLALLRRPELGDELSPPVADGLLQRQTEPQPRLAAGSALAASGATAMIDISDGLGADAGHLAAASGVGLVITGEDVPLAAGLAEAATAADYDPLDLALAGGEDYELLAALPAERAEEALETLKATGVTGTVIGAATEGDGVEVRRSEGAGPAPAGYDQLGR